MKKLTSIINSFTLIFMVTFALGSMGIQLTEFFEKDETANQLVLITGTISIITAFLMYITGVRIHGQIIKDDD